MDTSSIKAQAQLEIAKIQDKAVAEWLTVKTGHYSFKVVAIVAAAAFAVGLLVHLI